MKLKLLILLFLVVGSVRAQYTLVPDVNFEKKLIALGYDSGIPDGKVLTETVAKVTTLFVSDSAISDLTGIEDFLRLEWLVCSGNQLTNLDFSKNTVLKNLICFNNKLTNLDVSHNAALILLTCSDNQLKNLDVSRNTELTTLTCGDNQLMGLDITNNVNLKWIYCQDNPLTNLDMSKNPFLDIENSELDNHLLAVE